MERMPLRGIVDADLRLQTTLVVPPARPMQRNDEMLARIAEIDEQLARREKAES
jgi:hypothetical protein